MPSGHAVRGGAVQSPCPLNRIPQWKMHVLLLSSSIFIFTAVSVADLSTDKRVSFLFINVSMGIVAGIIC